MYLLFCSLTPMQIHLLHFQFHLLGGEALITSRFIFKKMVFVELYSVTFIRFHQFCDSWIHLIMDFYKLDYCLSSTFPAILFFHFE